MTLDKFSEEAIVEAEAAARLDPVHLIHAFSLDGCACVAYYDT